MSTELTNQSWRKLGVVLETDESKDAWDQRPSAPFILRQDDRLLMYFHGEQFFTERDKLRRVGLAEASVDDPLTWKKVQDEPLIDLGPEGSIDSHLVAYPWVVQITDTHWHMYYAAWDGTFLESAPEQKAYTTALAESYDGGATWRRGEEPLLKRGRPYSPDEHGTGSCAVIRVGDEYWMYYTALSVPSPRWGRVSTALAVSKDDGHTFQPHAAGAVINIPPRIDTGRSTSSKPFVERNADRFDIWYSCAVDGASYRVHYAQSDDGVRFRWRPDPVIDVSPMGWDSEMTCYPFVLHLDGRTLMFYDGNDYAGIGVAELVS